MMNQRRYTLALSIVLLCFAASGADAVTQSWYSIAFDQIGNKVDVTYDNPYISETVVTSMGDGFNGTWYYYPALGRYIMWFHNGPYSTNKKGVGDLWTFIGGLDGTKRTYYELDLGWTSQQWTDGSRPPMPANVNSQAVYELYTNTSHIDSGTGLALGNSTREGNHQYTIEQYNPEWFFISVQGQNMVLYRYLLHGTNDSQTPGTQGACCNQSTGDCYITTAGSCQVGYTYLGDNTTCASCTTQQSYLDFGDAPSSYRTMLSTNGARHYVSANIRLGQLIGGEPDGQPGQNADWDIGDDGVEFQGDLSVGQTAEVQITASTLGAVNAWLDLNGDGDWDDAQEQVLMDEPVATGNTSLSFFIPESALSGPSYMRFRFNTAGGLGPYGLAADGEVEDYAVTLVEDQPPVVTPLTPVPPSNKITTHWSQPAQRINSNQPILTGWSAVSSYEQGPAIADDWTLSQTMAIQGFRWWGAFHQWTLSGLPEQRPDAFHIGIWSSDTALDSPGTMVWETLCDSWNWALAGQLESGQIAFEFSAFLSQDEWFIPENVNTTTTYWVSISAIYDTPSQLFWPWQWLTTPDGHDSPAIMIQTVTNGATGQGANWPPSLGSHFLSGDYVTNPGNTGWDMAFELMTNKPVGASGQPIQGDVNGDGVVNAVDLGVLISLL
ncbi:MAG: hypothetical protein GY809_31860 [Planctomycetes bacterium]|nr:hypothetical protein [Planctomycetota bacterium]